MEGESHEMCGWVCDLWAEEWRGMRRSGLYDTRNGAGDEAEHRDIRESHVAHRRKTCREPRRVAEGAKRVDRRGMAAAR